MSTVAAEVGLTATGLPPQGRLAAAWGTAEQQARVFGALRASLADEMLPPLRAEVQELLPHFSWFLVAETMRIADSPQWRLGLHLLSYEPHNEGRSHNERTVVGS